MTQLIAPESSITLPTFTHFPQPRYGPARTPGWLSEEPEITRVCRAMRKEPQPWQRYVWDVATQYKLDHMGRRCYKYRSVLITVPRQSGKTTLLQPLRVLRMMIYPGAHLFSTAQTQKHAGKRMRDMIRAVELSPLSPLFHPKKGKGDEGLILVENLSDVTQFTPNEEAIHGETTPYVDLDEIWKFSQELGDGILGGIRPAQATLGKSAQRWFTSTMGTLQSEFMNSMVEEGRSGTNPSLCYIEYSLADGLDPYDPVNWWTFHPALGNTIDIETLQEETSLPEGDWLRGYCNRLTEVAESLVALEDWDDMADPDQIIPSMEEVTVGFEIAPGNENAAVVAAWYDADDNPHAHVLHQAQGTAWLFDYILNLHRMGFTQFAADDAGPVRRLLDRFDEDFPLHRLAYGERRLADQTLITAMRDDQTLIHDGSKPLRLAIASAQARITNGTELLDRDKSMNPIPSLIALSVALYANAHIQPSYAPIIAA